MNCMFDNSYNECASVLVEIPMCTDARASQASSRLILASEIKSFSRRILNVGAH